MECGINVNGNKKNLHNSVENVISFSQLRFANSDLISPETIHNVENDILDTFPRVLSELGTTFVLHTNHLISDKLIEANVDDSVPCKCILRSEKLLKIKNEIAITTTTRARAK